MRLVFRQHDVRGAPDRDGRREPIVGIIDNSGLKLDHPDVLLNVWINEGELPAGMRANGAPGTGADFDGSAADGLTAPRQMGRQVTLRAPSVPVQLH